MLFLRIIFPFFIFTVILRAGHGTPASVSTTVKKGATDSLSGFRDHFYPAIRESERIISHTAFALCYDEQAEQAKWVAYRLSAEMLGAEKEERSDNFRIDKAVETGSATPEDYKKSGYDRGHLCPAGDMAASEKTMSESFLMSNMSPQKPAFNRGIWKKLEEDVRGWARENAEIYVVTAGVLENNCGVIGASRVAVPRYYYKVILDVQRPVYKAIAFILPNEGSSRSVFDYAVSIDSVEKLTYIDFFPALPDKLENQLESEVNAQPWR